MHHSSTETTIIVLEWLGTFFLAIEAIKLHNFAALREHLRRFVRAFNPITKFVARSPGYATAEKRAGTIFNLWTLTGLGVLSLAAQHFGMTKFPPTDLAHLYLPSFPYSDGVYGALLIVVGIPMCTTLGYMIFRLCFAMLTGIVRTLEFLERNTLNGVIGVTGFVLFSVAASMKLSALH